MSINLPHYKIEDKIYETDLNELLKETVTGLQFMIENRVNIIFKLGEGLGLGLLIGYILSSYASTSVTRTSSSLPSIVLLISKNVQILKNSCCFCIVTK